MSAQEWAAITVSILTIIAGITGGIKWLVKHYLQELKPNGGSSIKDQVNRLESQYIRLEDKFDKILDILLNKNVK